ncbi:plasma membrane iron permease [Tothia fuscella]|uniref:Plasma membrane iron permease n=1 Tax=Tothia fuscella TaxID=1048955 RepID=A0A9P4TV20_9PEZI|nr:plasma membrane iron permease [Tothia fuscella]
MVNVFAVPVFFICFRECLETSIIVSVLLAFLKQTLGPDRDPAVYKKLVRQVWLGIAAGLAICLIVGCGMIGAFYGLRKDVFAPAELLWEGIFGVIASVIITLMGAALLRVSKLQEKWRLKIARAIESKEKPGAKFGQKFKHFSEKYAMFLLPFVTVLREGLEAIVFIGGVGVGMPASSFPLAVICGVLAGVVIGFLIYKGGNRSALQVFLIISTCFLYLVAAGLFSRAVWNFENREWNKIIGGDAAETGSGAGSYDIRQSVWHVNCCNPGINGGGGWGVFNSLLGWQNSATYGSVLSYNLYWLVVIIGFLAMGYNEKKGHWPFMKSKHADGGISRQQSASDSSTAEKVAVQPSTKIHEVHH